MLDVKPVLRGTNYLEFRNLSFTEVVYNLCEWRTVLGKFSPGGWLGRRFSSEPGIKIVVNIASFSQSLGSSHPLSRSAKEWLVRDAPFRL